MYWDEREGVIVRAPNFVRIKKHPESQMNLPSLVVLNLGKRVN